MDIHKPKAAHSWREFLIEIGTIVCGILIALGLEQAVEWAHTRRETAETREALKKEMAENTGAAFFLAAQERCLLAWSDRAIAWAKGGVRPNLPAVADASLSSTVWEASRGGGVAKMPTDERLWFASYYNLVDQQQRLSRQIDDAVVRLNRYALLKDLSPLQAQSFIEEVNSAKTLAAKHVVIEHFAIRDASYLKIAPKPPTDVGLISRICNRMGGRVSFELPKNEPEDFEWYTKIISASAP